jgi:hypothetical protein
MPRAMAAKIAKGVPEGYWKLAGGGANAVSVNHRNDVQRECTPEGVPELRMSVFRRPAGAESFVDAGSGGSRSSATADSLHLRGGGGE